MSVNVEQDILCHMLKASIINSKRHDLKKTTLTDPSDFVAPFQAV
jgi:hypothetical protein